MNYINKETFSFLKEIWENNNKVWFNQNKQRYLDIKKNLQLFAEHWLSGLMDISNEYRQHWIKPYLFRIHRDARFSMWVPYKQNFWILLVYWGRPALHSRAWLYLHIENWACFIYWWAYMPDLLWLENIRENIAKDSSKFRKIISNKEFKKYFELDWRKLKTAPRWYSKDHKDIDLLNYKDFWAIYYFKDSDLLSDNFLDELNEKSKLLLEFNDYLNLLIPK